MNFTEIEKLLQIKFTDQSLIETAFTHRSYLNEHRDYQNPSNERLEFLGDAVLQFLTSEYLYKNYTESPEGVMTSFRAALVRTETLGDTAKELGFGEHLLMSQGEIASGGQHGQHTLANTFEAVIGAIFLEAGVDSCRTFLEKYLFSKMEEIIQTKTFKDSKSALQELCQEKYNVTPAYKLLSEEGPDHNKQFQVGVYVNKKLIGEGAGNSKQRAQQQAAALALEKISNKR